VTNLPPGIGAHWPITEAEYHADRNHVRSGEIKSILPPWGSPGYWASGRATADSASLRLGSAADVAILSPNEFDRRFVVAPEWDARTKAGKAIRDEFMANHPLETVLRPDEYEAAMRMRASVLSHPVAARILLSCEGRTQFPIRWTDAATGLACKAMLDGLGSTEDGYPINVSLKTSREPHPAGFARSIASYGYHVQDAHYHDAIAAFLRGQGETEPVPIRTVYIVVGNSEASGYETFVYEHDEASVAAGARLVRKGLAEIARCRADGVARSAGSLEMQTISVPKWALKTDEEGGDAP
jgi:exodeoxyribonuclease VIII